MADIDPLLPYIKPGWTGVEIGVGHGHSAEALLAHGVGYLYLIDPWELYADYLEVFSEETLAHAFRETVRRVLPYAGRVIIYRLSSANAAPFVREVDFVWVDGNHRYEWVKSDMELYWPKIRPGGILCGHDYTNTPYTCQVQCAVDEFVAVRYLGLEVVSTTCWLIRKGT